MLRILPVGAWEITIENHDTGRWTSGCAMLDDTQMDVGLYTELMIEVVNRIENDGAGLYR